MLNNLDDFLQNLDGEAGRRMEVLELDIIHTRSGLCEELGKLKKELKDPQQEIEERVSSLEQQMEQMNRNGSWKETRPRRKAQSNQKATPV
jgi:hypothetical protein